MNINQSFMSEKFERLQNLGDVYICGSHLLYEQNRFLCMLYFKTDVSQNAWLEICSSTRYLNLILDKLI